MPRLDDIQIRDPFVLPVPEEGRYYLFGSTDKDVWSGPATGFDAYWSENLDDWHGPLPAFRPAPDFWSRTQFWAPEVHRYDGAYFMFASFTAPGRHRGTQVLRSDRPEGPFEPWSPAPVTPAEWECLDGTLFLEDGEPWMVFCHEWVDLGDGDMSAIRLTPDLAGAVGEPVRLFTATEAEWVRPFVHPDVPDDMVAYITDGPFLHRTAEGLLLMLWSSFSADGYALTVATSESGRLVGPWTQEQRPLFPRDGGHGMLFRTFGGELRLALHQPNDTPNERARFIPVVETPEGLRLVEG